MKSSIDFDLKMQEGYQYLYNDEYNKVIEIWVSVWNELMDYMEKNNIILLMNPR